MVREEVLAGIYPALERSDVQVRLPNGKIWGGPAGTSLEAFIRKAAGGPGHNIVAARMGNRLVELSETVQSDVDVYPVPATSVAGLRVVQHSYILLLVAAAAALYPEGRISVEYSVSSGGLYCRVLDRPPFSGHELAALQTRMLEIVDGDWPIERERLPLPDAIAYFERNGDPAKARLLAQSGRSSVTLHRLGDVREFFYDGLLVPTTDRLKQPELRPHNAGFVLQFPVRGRPVQPIQDSTKLPAVFERYNQDLAQLGVLDVGALNQAFASGRAREIVLVAEALHDKHIAEMAAEIAGRAERVRLILIAGPSSSGKTTFARRLSIQLLANGLRPFPLSLDDYFLPRESTPRDERGRPDFESLYALDLESLNHDVVQLMRGEAVALPHYNFITGLREPGPRVQLSPEHVLVIEGIHGLNPALLPDVPPGSIFRVYASALTQLKLGRVNRIPTTETRLIRRLVRDAQTRGYSAQVTLSRWESVVRGEELHIFPFQDNADAMFNSALVYELGALRPMAESLLRQVEPETPEYIEARRLLDYMQWFQPCDQILVPEDSILREFLGGSVLDNFVPHI